MTATYAEIEAHLADQVPFIGSSSRAFARPRRVDQRRLNDTEYALLREALDRRAVSYVVCSYGTPVAWVADDRPYVVAQTFNPSTARLQSLCRRHLGNRGSRREDDRHD